MEWQMMVALLIAVPIVLIPAALIWYLNVGGICAAIREVMGKAAQQERLKALGDAEKIHPAKV